MACASECGEGINPVPTATLQEARDATSWRGGTTDALWFQTMVTTLASSSWTHIAEISPWSIWMGRALHGKASAQTHAKHKNPDCLFLKHRLQGLQKAASSFRPLFCGRAYSVKYRQVSENGRLFSK